MERFPSGQRGRAVNPLAKPSEVRILPSPFCVLVGVCIDVMCVG